MIRAYIVTIADRPGRRAQSMVCCTQSHNLDATRLIVEFFFPLYFRQNNEMSTGKSGRIC